MLTFEKIRDLERAERENKQLEKLPENVLQELGEYLRRKEAIKNKTEFDIREIENVKNTINRLLELREHKIMNLALYSARTGMPVENLMKIEEDLFNQVVESLREFRKKFYEELNTPTEPQKTEKNDVKEEKSIVRYKVVKDLINFVGPDGNEYSFKAGDIIKEDDIPKSLNDLLLKKGIIEKL